MTDDHDDDEIDRPSHDGLAIPSTNVLQLIQAHLTEAGLHRTAQCLQHEAGVGLAGCLGGSLPWSTWCTQGQWDQVLAPLTRLDLSADRSPPALLSLVAHVQAHMLLEVGQDDLNLAHALYRLLPSLYLDQAVPMSRLSNQEATTTKTWTWRRFLEQRLARVEQSKDYFGTQSKQAYRQLLGQALSDAQASGLLPTQPPQRLVTLLQQAVQWQSHTGTLLPPPPNKKRARTDDKDDTEQVYSLVLGQATVPVQIVGHEDAANAKLEKTIRKVAATIKIGKHAVVTATAWWLSAEATYLLTGSSDGLIEVWHAKTGQLATELAYQGDDNDDGMAHASAVLALAVSPDGALLASASADQVCLWRLDTGTCVRTLPMETTVVTTLAWLGETLVVASATTAAWRQYSVRSGRLLHEGPTPAPVTTCHCSGTGDQVVVGTAEGSVHWFQGGIERLSWKAPSRGSMLLVEVLHTPRHAVVAVSAHKAYLLRTNADQVVQVVQTFAVPAKADGADHSIVAAAVSSMNQWLYAVTAQGSMYTWSLETGDVEDVKDDFASQSTSTTTSGSPELTHLLYHPNQRLMAAFSNQDGQKKGKLVVWK